MITIPTRGMAFSPHNADLHIFQTGLQTVQIRVMEEHGMLVYLSHYHAGLWVVDVESLMVAGLDGTMNRTQVYSDSTVAFHLPNAGVTLDSTHMILAGFPSYGQRNIMKVTHTYLVLLDYTSCSWILTNHTVRPYDGQKRTIQQGCIIPRNMMS